MGKWQWQYQWVVAVDGLVRVMDAMECFVCVGCVGYWMDIVGECQLGVTLESVWSGSGIAGG